VASPELNQRIKKRNGIVLFWILVACISAGASFSGWRADNTLSRQLSPINILLAVQDDLSSSVRTLNIETRNRSGEGVLEETSSFITGFKVEAFNYANRLPSYYRLRSPGILSKNYSCGIPKLPCSPLVLTHILRI